MTEPTEEFLFGSLSTHAGRLEEARRAALGFYEVSLLEPLDPEPGEPIRLRFRCGADLSLERLLVFWTADGHPPQWSEAGEVLGATRCTAARPGEVSWNVLVWGYVREWAVELPPQPEGTLLQYVALGYDVEGRCFPCPTSPKRHEGGGLRSEATDWERHGSPQLFAVGIDRLEPPQWFRRAVIYQVLVDRFAPDPGKRFSDAADLTCRLGGTLGGLAQHLDDLCELGIDTLWLTPVFASPDYHGYAASDFWRIEPALGGDPAWEALTESAHRRGMRVILDFVANHVSCEHPAFIEALRSPESPTRSWFRFRDWPKDYACFFNVASQPELDAEQPPVRDHLLGAACHWLGRGCDGFRLDYALGLSHGFWSRFRAATRRTLPESVCFGEITHLPPVVRSYAGRFDGCLDFGLCELLRGTFARRDLALGDFDRQMRRHLAYFGKDLVLPTFLDNHDMNRFLWLADGDRRRLKLAALVQFLLPGPPVIYYGTEVGLSQKRTVGALEEARLPMPERHAWDLGLRDFYRRLIRLRCGIEPWRFQPELLRIDPEGAWASWRIGSAVLVVNGGEAECFIPSPGASVLLATDRDIGDRVQDGRLRLPAWTGAVLSVSGVLAPAPPH